MQVSRAAAIWLEYHRTHSRQNPLKSHQTTLATFLDEFAGRQIGEISTEEVNLFPDVPYLALIEKAYEPAVKDYSDYINRSCS